MGRMGENHNASRMRDTEDAMVLVRLPESSNLTA